MKVTLSITENAAFIAAKEVASLALTMAQFPIVENSEWQRNRTSLTFLFHKTPCSTIAEEDDRIAEGSRRAVDAAKYQHQPFGWITSSGNLFVVNFDPIQGWILVFDTRRHALAVPTNGVGSLFQALGGLSWARAAAVLSVESRSTSPWYLCDVKDDRRVSSLTSDPLALKLVG